jgi:hypothetical protein
MPVHFTDPEISKLIVEVKSLPIDYRSRMVLKPKMGHKEQELNVVGSSGTHFRIILRQATINPLSFSAILAYIDQTSNTIFRLRRYNGKHMHSNVLEATAPFYGFHIHEATERYQRGGFREDAYALESDRFSDFATAVECLIKDCGFVVPVGETGSLFG